MLEGGSCIQIQENVGEDLSQGIIEFFIRERIFSTTKGFEWDAKEMASKVGMSKVSDTMNISCVTWQKGKTFPTLSQHRLGKSHQSYDCIVE
jgi:hypothetical protein